MAGFIICIVLLILFVAAVYVRRKRLAARDSVLDAPSHVELREADVA